MTIPPYAIIVFRSPADGCWIADVPDLRPCSAHGETEEEALAEAKTAIRLWLEVARADGLPIPEPRYRPISYSAALAA
jgi:predicted RNase H-like HicB family nuclease